MVGAIGFKNETRVVPMTPDVFGTFAELHKERRLDTPRVFLYNKEDLHEAAAKLQRYSANMVITLASSAGSRQGVSADVGA